MRPKPGFFNARRLLIGMVCSAAASQALAYNLSEAYQDALSNDAKLASARAALEADRQLVPLARSRTRPQINGSAAVNRIRSDTNLTDPANFTGQTYGVNLQWPLYAPAARTAVDQSMMQLTIGEAQLASAEQDLVLRVAEAYFNVLAADNTYSTTIAEKTAIAEQLAAAKRNFEVGTATITDQQEAQARFDLAVAQELAAQNALEVARAALSQLTGKPVPKLADLAADVTLAPPEPSVESAWTTRAREDNLIVQQAALGTDIARAEIDRQRYAGYPTLAAVGQLAYAKNPSASFVGVSSNTASAGLQLSVPIYSGGGVDAGVRQASANLDRANADLEVVRREAEQAARQSYLGLASGLSQVKALEAAEKSSQLALDSNRLGYRVGVRINIDVLNAQQQLFKTQRDLARARYDVLLNGLRLKSTIGALANEELTKVSTLLSETAKPPGSGGASPSGANEAPESRKTPAASPAASSSDEAARAAGARRVTKPIK